MLGRGLRTIDASVAQRLLSLVEAKTTELLAAPLHAGTVTLRIDREEEAVLLSLTRTWVRSADRLHESPGLVRLWAELDGRVDSDRDAMATDAVVLALAADVKAAADGLGG
jgi:hypothetical protein